MAKQRIIQSKFWSDSYIQWLSSVEKLFYLYLLTNEHTNIAWAYEISVRTMVFESDIEESKVKKALENLVKDGKVLYIDWWLVIRNFIKHQSTSSSQVKKGIEKYMSLVPKHILDKVSIRSTYPQTGYNILEPELESEPESKLEVYTPTGDFDYWFVDEFVESQREYHQVENQINKVWMEKYMSDQYKALDKLIKDGYTHIQIKFVLKYVLTDEFRKPIIMTVKKLRDKDKSGNEYVLVLIDRIKNRSRQQDKANFNPLS